MAEKELSKLQAKVAQLIEKLGEHVDNALHSLIFKPKNFIQKKVSKRLSGSAVAHPMWMSNQRSFISTWSGVIY